MLLPSRKLDAMVAKHIEGLPVEWAPDPFRIPDRRLTEHFGWINGTVDGRHYDWEPVKRYSSDWNAMKLVVEAMHKYGWGLHLWSSVSTHDRADNRLVYYADFKRFDSSNINSLPGHEQGMSGDEAPLVVVRAALCVFAESDKPGL